DVTRLAQHPRDLVRALDEVGQEASGELVKLGMGPFRPYLVTHPDHVRHVLRTNQPNYVREGMFWDPLVPLIGRGILSDGPDWAESRRIIQPLFTARHLNTLADRLAVIVDELIGEILAPDRPFDVAEAIKIGRAHV